MAKQQRPKLDTTRLADIENIEKSVGEVTGQKTGKTFSLADAEPPKKREPGLTSKGRAKVTTMIKPELRAMLQAVADNNSMSLADVLEIVLVEYFGLKK